MSSNTLACFILTRAIGAGPDVELAVPSSPGNRIYGIKALGYINGQTFQVNDCIQFLDSPGSVGVITYKLKIYGAIPIAPTATTGFFINRAVTDSAATPPASLLSTRATSQVILQEIFA
jgi:hypothetical protein